MKLRTGYLILAVVAGLLFAAAEPWGVEARFEGWTGVRCALGQVGAGSGWGRSGVATGSVSTLGASRRNAAAFVVSAQLVQPPIEARLSVGTTRFLRTVRRWTRRLLRIISWSAQQWANWTVSAVGVVVFALLAPIVDRQLLRTWREHGFAAFRASIGLALAIYIRLLVDRRAPAIGKVLLGFGVLYGVAPHDLLPDRIGVLGLVDDAIVVGLTSRVFTRLCPDRLVEEHAVKAARAWDRALRAQVPRGAIGESPR
jgi:uncharacterized membrane protein YkvA (DUF1232 family)